MSTTLPGPSRSGRAENPPFHLLADEVELDDVYETECQLFNVACTRARDRLFVSGVTPASEFLNDMEPTLR